MFTPYSPPLQAHLRSRTKVVGAVARVRSALAHAVHTFFTQNDFFYLHTPLVTTSDCEGAGEAFQVTTMDLKNIPLVRFYCCAVFCVALVGEGCGSGAIQQQPHCSLLK